MASARGLIHLMPATSKEAGVSDFYNPAKNIKGGVKYLSRMRDKFENVTDSIQRIKFTLGAFNCGAGHVFDAMRLAKKYGKDPTIWDDNVEEYILKLKSKKYYLDDAVKYGFMRGEEPYHYVKDIFMRYDHYKKFISLED